MRNERAVRRLMGTTLRPCVRVRWFHHLRVPRRASRAGCSYHPSGVKRCLPSIVIAGQVKCATTSMFDTLARHPVSAPPPLPAPAPPAAARERPSSNTRARLSQSRLPARPGRRPPQDVLVQQAAKPLADKMFPTCAEAGGAETLCRVKEVQGEGTVLCSTPS